MDNVTFSRDSQIAHFGVVDPAGKPGQPLALSASGPGYGFKTHLRGGYPGNGPVLVPLEAPDHSLLGNLCIRNVGKAKLALAGTAEGRTVSRSYTKIDGQQQPQAHVSLTLQRRYPAALAPRIPTMLARVAALNPTTPWMVWLLALATLLLVPLGTFWALASGLAAGRTATPQPSAPAPPFP